MIVFITPGWLKWTAGKAGGHYYYGKKTKNNGRL